MHYFKNLQQSNNFNLNHVIQSYNASVVYAVALCLSVSVISWYILSNWLNIVSCKQGHIIAHGLKFSATNNLVKIHWGNPPWTVPNAAEVDHS